jgi:hypothetical protein
MKFIKKLGVIFAAIAFCLSLTVATSYAQPGKAGWKNNNGKHKGWYKGQRNGWNKGRKTGWLNRTGILSQQDWRNNRTTRRTRTGRLTSQELRQLQRRQTLLNRTRNRYYSDGYLTNRESRKLNKRTNKYQRRVRRDTRDW